MPIAQDILGMNARNRLFSSLNPPSAKSFAASKYATKLLLDGRGIAVPQTYGLLATQEDVNYFDWHSLEKNFVIKPTNGSAGKGIVAFKTKLPNENRWRDALGHTWSLEDIKLHCFDILEGQYSTWGAQHHIIVEERIVTHPAIAKYVAKGTPDLRIIIYNQVPVMAMLRLPTEESEGRANLHQGAIGAGIDMASGVTTHAITGKGAPIQYLPGTKKKLNGIKIPFWKKCLTTAVEAAAAAGLKYSGVDLFIHPEVGPQVVELNANPGLSIQIANQSGLRRRLERVKDLKVLNSDHGVRIGRALFAETFADKIISEEGLLVVNPHEKIIALSEAREKIEVPALMHTGRYRSAISKKFAQSIGLADLDDLLWFQQEKKEGMAPVVEATIYIKERKIKTTMVVSQRLDRTKHKVEIGRRDLIGILVGENQ